MIILMEFRYFISYILVLFIHKKLEIDISGNTKYYGYIKYLDLQHYWLRDTI